MTGSWPEAEVSLLVTCLRAAYQFGDRTRDAVIAELRRFTEPHEPSRFELRHPDLARRRGQQAARTRITARSVLERLGETV